MENVEVKRMIARWLIEQKKESEHHITLLRLRSTSKVWFDVINKILRLTYGNRLIGRATMIPMRMCMCCKEERIEENLVYELRTKNDNYIVFCADRTACKIAALYAAIDELYILGGILGECIKENANVKRTSGAVETDWDVFDIRWFTCKEMIYVSTIKDNLTRTNNVYEFAALNPHLRGKEIIMRKTTFDDPIKTARNQMILEECGFKVVSNFIIDFIIAK